jgi:hypothetical protein
MIECVNHRTREDLLKLCKEKNIKITKKMEKANIEELRTDIFKKILKQNKIKPSPILTRLYLEQILPCFKEPVLFLGWAKYTEHYNKIIPMISVDYNEKVNPDITADVTKPELKTKINKYIKDNKLKINKFNSLIINGVIGWGVNENNQINDTLKNCRDLLKTNGKMLVGWNIKKTEGSNRIITKDEMIQFLKNNKFKKIKYLDDVPDDSEWNHKYILCSK